MHDQKYHEKKTEGSFHYCLCTHTVYGVLQSLNATHTVCRAFIVAHIYSKNITDVTLTQQNL